MKVINVGNKRRDEQQVNGQARGAGHEGRDQDGSQAVALVFNGARGHDGRHGAGISGDEGDKRFALQAELGHGAVGYEGRAREIAGIFENSYEQEQQEVQHAHIDETAPMDTDSASASNENNQEEEEIEDFTKAPDYDGHQPKPDLIQIMLC